MEERLLCAFGLSDAAPVEFESCEAIPHGGVMLLLPFILECGLLSYRQHYSQRSGYYNFDSLFIIMAFIYLCRAKSIEQVKRYSPGEFGKLVGYDRIPEVKTFRRMIREITAQKQADKWGAALSKSWIEEEKPELYYVDGHVQVYHGYLANLGKKHVSRQRLCLPGMMEFWVNAQDGQPYFFITAKVNEKMEEILKAEIIPELIRLHPVSAEQKKRMEENPDEPLFTLVFDREAYSPSFFCMLWEDFRIAVITYRKNVKDKWNETLFTDCKVETTLGETTMKLHEQKFQTGNCTMREVRRLCSDVHQTSIVSTNRVLKTDVIASHLFARWSQENFFRYMRQDFALDKIIQYSVDKIDDSIKVVNREYSNLSYKIKKEREKLSRLQAKLYELEQQNHLEQNDEKTNRKWIKDKLELFEKKTQVEDNIASLVDQRKEIPYKIPLSDMPPSCRYNCLNRESKALQNIIKIICYRAETALATLLAPHYKRANQEIRSLIKMVIDTPVDIEVDTVKEVLKITLYPLANIRSYEAIAKICETVNATETIYPGTCLKLCFVTKTVETAP